MKLRSYAILLFSIVLTSVLMAPLHVKAQGLPFALPRNSVAPPGPDPMDLSVAMLGEKEIAIRNLAADVGPALATRASPSGSPAAVGDEVVVTVTDAGLNIDYNETFVVIMDGTHGIILIEKAAYTDYDAIMDEYVFPNPSGCWRSEDRISTAMLAYLLDQFDNTIYPVTATVFGTPLPRGAEGMKTWILIHNIRDESYYDCSATSYTGGYFSASENAAQNKNMMHIDSFDWANRVGPDAPRPFLYENIFAHEFEHLVHFDQDPDEESWVDEGLADLAPFLCGYGHPPSHLAYYMVYHPMVALTYWAGGLENYGACYLFQLYLFEKYGGAAFVSALVQEQANGIEGVAKTLAAFGYRQTFDEVFDNWTIANYLDDTRKSGGKYGYETLAIGSIDTWGYTIEYSLRYWGLPPAEAPFSFPSDWFFGIEPQPYTAHYFRFNNPKKAALSLDGDDFTGVLAYSGSYEWYSGTETWAWRSFYQTFTIPAGGATLNFYTFYDIEVDWDYGYVEVYDQDTGEWYTLPAAGTVNSVLHAQDNPNVPAGREPADYFSAGRWNAFTGSSGGWVPVSMDLTPFAGHTIDLYFTTWQDGAYGLRMMYVDDIAIPEIGFLDDAESGPDGWATSGWYLTDGILENGIGAMTIDTKWVPIAQYPEPAGNNAMPLHGISEMDVDPASQTGMDKVSATPANSGRVKVTIVTNHADHVLPSHYEFEVE